MGTTKHLRGLEADLGKKVANGRISTQNSRCVQERPLSNGILWNTLHRKELTVNLPHGVSESERRGGISGVRSDNRKPVIKYRKPLQTPRLQLKMHNYGKAPPTRYKYRHKRVNCRPERSLLGCFGFKHRRPFPGGLTRSGKTFVFTPVLDIHTIIIMILLNCRDGSQVSPHVRYALELSAYVLCLGACFSPRTMAAGATWFLYRTERSDLAGGGDGGFQAEARASEAVNSGARGRAVGHQDAGIQNVSKRSKRWT